MSARSFCSGLLVSVALLALGVSTSLAAGGVKGSRGWAKARVKSHILKKMSWRTQVKRLHSVGLTKSRKSVVVLATTKDGSVFTYTVSRRTGRVRSKTKGNATQLDAFQTARKEVSSHSSPGLITSLYANGLDRTGNYFQFLQRPMSFSDKPAHVVLVSVKKPHKLKAAPAPKNIVSTRQHNERMKGSPLGFGLNELPVW